MTTRTGLRLAAIGLLLAACVSKPTMHLNHAEVIGVQLATFPPSLGILMTVVVDVYNPNSYDVAVRAMRGQAIMADKYSLPMDYRAPGNGVWLPAGKTTSVRVPIDLPLNLAIELIREAIQAPAIPYRFIGTADVTATSTFQIEKDNYSVDERGFLSREQMEAVIPASFAPH